MVKRQKPNTSIISHTPILDAYAKRIGAIRKNFRTYVVEEEERRFDGTVGYINRRFPHLRYPDIDIAMSKHSFKKVSVGLHHKADAVDCLSYWPARPTGITNEKNRKTFNDHVKSDIRPEKGSDFDQEFIRKFYEYLYPNESERIEVIRWDATLVCCPEVFMGWGRLCISDTQGVGKTTHASILAELVGYHNVSFPSEAQVIGRFNGWLAHTHAIISHCVWYKISGRSLNNGDLECELIDQLDTQLAG